MSLLSSNAMSSISLEIYYLFLITVFCTLLWIPYVLERFVRIGIKETCGYNDKSKNIAQWSSRARSAHKNLIENLPLFAILIIIIHLFELNNFQTQTGSIIFFYSRILHYFCYLFAIPWLRTGFFLTSWLGLLIISIQIFNIN